MKAIAIIPRKANSIHLREIPKPSVGDVEGGRTVRSPPTKSIRDSCSGTKSLWAP